MWILWIHDPDLDFPKKNTPSASSSGPSQLGETTGVQIYFLKGDIKKKPTVALVIHQNSTKNRGHFGKAETKPHRELLL